MTDVKSAGSTVITFAPVQFLFDKAVTKVFDSCQEQLMFENFSAIVLKARVEGAAGLDSFWPTVTLKTQVPPPPP